MTNTGIEIRLGDIVYVLSKKWKTILLFTLVGLMFGAIMTGATSMNNIQRAYQVSGSFSLVTTTNGGGYLGGANAPGQQDFHLAEDMVSAAIYVMKSDKVLNEVISNLSLLGVTPRDIRSTLTLKQYSSTQIIEATLLWDDAEEGINILNTLIRCSQRQLPATLSVGSLVVINTPTATYLAAPGVDKTLLLFAVAIGLFFGVALVITEMLMHPTITNAKDIDSVFNLETLGTIPESAEYFRGDSALNKSGQKLSQITQDYAAAAYIVRNRLGNKGTHNVFYVTSTIEGEGKTSIVANLGIHIAAMEHKVLLIDMDTRNPNLGTLFMKDLDYNRSLNAVYQGDALIDEAIIHVNGYLDVLPTVLWHKPIPMDSTVFDVINSLKAKYDYVILDSAPVGRISDTLSLNRVADTCLFVLRYDGAQISEIHAALDKLTKSGVRILGCIVNGVTMRQRIYGDVGVAGHYPKNRKTLVPTIRMTEIDGLLKNRVKPEEPAGADHAKQKRERGLKSILKRKKEQRQTIADYESAAAERIRKDVLSVDDEKPEIDINQALAQDIRPEVDNPVLTAGAESDAEDAKTGD